jgi:hypothetical protein
MEKIKTNPANIKSLSAVIEDIQRAVVESGGAFLSQQEVRDMTVEVLISGLLPNGVIFNVKHEF